MRKFAVIGLGNFGFYIAKTLYEEGHDVLAIDREEHIVQKIKDFASQAVIADSTDKDVLESLGISDVEVAIVGIGTNLEASILTTLALKESGVPEIVAKALTESHAKILSKLGASEIVFPERDVGIRVANSLSSGNMVDYLPLAPGYSIIEIAPPSSFNGKSIRNLHLRSQYGVQIVAIKDMMTGAINIVPEPDFVMKDSDMMILCGPDLALNKIKGLP